MIPDDQVEEVRARADIVDIVGEFVSLKKVGRQYKANCPFHEERTPSFYVTPEKGFYKCFGCGKSGDVFSFVMEKLGLDFVEAVRHVAARAGVELREVTRQRDEDDPNAPLYELNGFAQSWFRQCLTEAATGGKGQAYLRNRGIDAKTAERFGLGWAPDEWHSLRAAAAKHGLDEDLMVEVGLLARRERDNEPYDRFRGRIVFPIEALSGKVIAFGGRIVAEDARDAPKYLNSPETPIYHKGRNLYGLSWARHAIRREESAVLVEGYMDVVSLAAHGFENVVAPLGTALTPEQAKLLARYTERVFLLFDSDSAGLKATFRAGDTLLEEGLHPAVVTLPVGEDPDTLVRRQGAEALRGYLDDAVDVLDRKLQILEQRDFFTSIERTRQAVDRLLPTLRAAADPTLRDIYVAKVADRTGVRRETLEAELRRASAATPRPRVDVPRPEPSPAPRVPRMGAERELLLLMTKSRDFVEHAGERLAPEDLVDSAYRAIFQALLADPDLRSPPSSMDPVAAERLREILEDPEDIAHASRVFDDAVARIRVATLDRRLAELSRQIGGAEDEAEKLTLTEKKARLSRERRELAPDDWSTTARWLRADPNKQRNR
ncbi:MAG: DNA primase [Gemmatimonadetes bacterium]|nr:DNA primase [Gemmatimonadota bacterium]